MTKTTAMAAVRIDMPSLLAQLIWYANAHARAQEHIPRTWASNSSFERSLGDERRWIVTKWHTFCASPNFTFLAIIVSLLSGVDRRRRRISSLESCIFAIHNRLFIIHLSLEPDVTFDSNLFRLAIIRCEVADYQYATSRQSAFEWLRVSVWLAYIWVGNSDLCSYDDSAPVRRLNFADASLNVIFKYASKKCRILWKLDSIESPW